MIRARSKVVLIAALVSAAMSIVGGTVARAASAENPLEFEFHPSCQQAWEGAQRSLSKNNDETVAKMAVLDCTAGPAADDELELLRGQAFSKLELPLLAQASYLAVARRSANLSTGQMALHLLDRLATSYPIDDEDLEKFAVALDAPIQSKTAASMIAYYKYKGFSHRKLDGWAKAALARIAPGSAWSFELRYREAQEAATRGDLDAALAQFHEISKNAAARATTKQAAALQASRIDFEKLDFKSSFAQAQNLTLPVREKGRTLLQMAWSQYYVRDYGKALGSLEALRTPFFASSRTPERSILQMVIFKDLCQYGYMQSAVNRYFVDYAAAYSAIENRKQLEDDPQIQQMALLAEPLQTRANLVHELRSEIHTLAKILGPAGVAKALTDALSRREQSVRFALRSEIIAKTKAIAEDLIDAREQVKAIRYIAKIQSLSTERDVSKDYQSEVPPQFEFEKLYWPERTEYWWDEMPFYQALISSRCSDRDKSKAMGAKQ